MKVVWSRQDIENIREYICRESIRYADAVVAKIFLRSRQLRNFPRSGQIVPEYQRNEIREVLVHSFRVLYRIENQSVLIVTVVHGAKQLPPEPPTGSA